MENRAKTSRAIYYVLVFWFDFLIGLVATIYSLYLLSQGLDLLQVNLVNTVFMISSVIFEVPTGALADYAGRKICVLLSFALLPIGFGIYFFSTTMTWFMVAEVCTALAVACLSGALDAWVVDRLQQQGYSGKIDAVFSHGGMASGLALMTGGIIGAQLANVQLRWPFGVGAVVALVGLGIAYWGMREVRAAKQPTKWRWDVVRRSLHYSLKHPVVLWLFGATLLANLAFQPLNMYWAPRVAQLTQQQIWFLGYVWTGVAACLLAGSYLAKKLTKRTLSYQWLFVLTAIMLALPIIYIARTAVVATLLGGFFVYEIGRGLLGPLHKSYLNKHIQSHERATVLSFDSLVSKLGAAGGLILFGWLAKLFSIELTWLLAGIVLLGLIPLYSLAVRRSPV